LTTSYSDRCCYTISQSHHRFVFHSFAVCNYYCIFLLFFFNDASPTDIYTLSLRDALPISAEGLTKRSAVGFLLRSLIMFQAFISRHNSNFFSDKLVLTSVTPASSAPVLQTPKATSSTLYFDSLTVNAGNGGFLHCI